MFSNLIASSDILVTLVACINTLNNSGIEKTTAVVWPGDETKLERRTSASAS